MISLFAAFGSMASAAIGPFEIVDPNGKAALKLNLSTQLQMVWENKDNGVGKERDNIAFMRARRIRPALTLSLPKYKTSFRLHLSASPGSIELMDLYSDSKLSSWTNMRIGQYKIPYTRYRIQSFQRLTFVDWAIVTKYFGAERQMGFCVHNGYEKPPRWGYAIGIFNGVNSRASHAIGLSSIFGEKAINPSDLSGSSLKSKFHPELACHISYNGNNIDVSSDSDAEGGGFRYSLASSAAWDIDPTRYEDLAIRAAQEFLIKYRDFSFMGSGYIGLIDIDNSVRTRKAFTGLLSQAAYRLSERVEFSIRYAIVDIDGNLADSALSRARTIMAETDDPSIKSQYKSAGMILGEQEGTLGLNLYLDGHAYKVQNDFGFVRYKRRDENRIDYQVRTQLQLSF
jgi:hypothetical protein